MTTPELMQLVQAQRPYLLFDVLGGSESLPGAIPAVAASRPGNFSDPVQQQFGQFLQQGTQGNRDVPLVFYCQSTQCWMSYNAALRAIKLGYTNVHWYRGGIEAWKAAGLPTSPVNAMGGQVPSTRGQPPIGSQQPGYGQQPAYSQQPGSGQYPATAPQPGFATQPATRP